MPKNLWKAGESGNPRGRPPKSRALTAILEKAGNKALDVDGTRVAGKRLLAAMVWQLATTGKATFPDGTELQVSPRDWLEVVKWLYTQIDGPPKAEQAIELTGANGQNLVIEYVNDWRSHSVTSTTSRTDSGTDAGEAV